MFKRPESVLIVIYTVRGEVLQLRRREPADFWQSVTGSLLPGESPHRAALREIREETGLHADADLVDAGIVNRYPIHPAWRAKFAPDVTDNTEYVFSLRLPAITGIVLDPAEHLEYRWLPREVALTSASSVTDRTAIEKVVPAQPAAKE